MSARMLRSGGFLFFMLICAFAGGEETWNLANGENVNDFIADKKNVIEKYDANLMRRDVKNYDKNSKKYRQESIVKEEIYYDKNGVVVRHDSYFEHDPQKREKEYVFFKNDLVDLYKNSTDEVVDFYSGDVIDFKITFEKNDDSKHPPVRATRTEYYYKPAFYNKMGIYSETESFDDNDTSEYYKYKESFCTDKLISEKGINKIVTYFDKKTLKEKKMVAYIHDRYIDKAGFDRFECYYDNSGNKIDKKYYRDNKLVESR